MNKFIEKFDEVLHWDIIVIRNYISILKKLKKKRNFSIILELLCGLL